MSFFVYILASRRNGTLYVGMTDDLTRRYFEHKSGAVPGFTRKYGVKMLVWFRAAWITRVGLRPGAADQAMEPEVEA